MWALTSVFLFLGLAGAVIFAVWAYNSRQDYKTNVDQKISVAVGAAKQQESTIKDKQFVEKEKLPLKTYISSDINGLITIKYPKTWSAYVVDSGTSSSGTSGNPLDGYFHPKVVPDVNNSANNFALRVQLSTQTYNSVLQQYQAQVVNKQVTVRPYKFKNVPSVVGAKVTGQIQQNKNGTLIVMPLRDKTLELWTESNQFQKDFEKNILPNFKFSP